MNSLYRRDIETFCVFLIFIGITILVLVLLTLFVAAPPQQYNLMDILHTSQVCSTTHPDPLSGCLHDTASLHFSLNCEACHNTRLIVVRNPQPWLQELTCGDGTCHAAGRVQTLSQTWESRVHE